VLHDLRRGEPFDRALHRALSGLDDADRALAHEIAAGVLRCRDQLDAALVPFLSAGTAGVRDDVLDILRLGAYQLKFLDRIPRHAAVDTAVTLARRFGGAGVGGFVNAVLRHVSREADAQSRSTAETRPDPEAPARPETLALRYSHPAWLVARWTERFGAAQTERLLELNNSRPSLVIQPARWSEDAIITAFDTAGIAWHRATFGAGLIVEGRRPTELPGFGAGAWYVQDSAQAMVVQFAAIPQGALVFDAAAAPGGKAIALSKTARFLVAGDRHRSRVRRLRQNLERAGCGPAAALVADAEDPPVRAADVVLLDAPCLGTGVFTRHPDARWRVTEAALFALVAQSARLLRALAATVAQGGLLVFATCSLEPEENELQVEAFLESHPQFRREPPPTDLVPSGMLTEVGDLALLPHLHGSDGAFATRLRRTGA